MLFVDSKIWQLGPFPGPLRTKTKPGRIMGARMPHAKHPVWTPSKENYESVYVKSTKPCLCDYRLGMNNY